MDTDQSAPPVAAPPFATADVHARLHDLCERQLKELQRDERRCRREWRRIRRLRLWSRPAGNGESLPPMQARPGDNPWVETVLRLRDEHADLAAKLSDVEAAAEGIEDGRARANLLATAGNMRCTAIKILVDIGNQLREMHSQQVKMRDGRQRQVTEIARLANQRLAYEMADTRERERTRIMASFEQQRLRILAGKEGVSGSAAQKSHAELLALARSKARDLAGAEDDG